MLAIQKGSNPRKIITLKRMYNNSFCITSNKLQKNAIDVFYLLL